jgi:hypothetical protein
MGRKRPLNHGKRAEQNRNAQRAFRGRREQSVRILYVLANLLPVIFGSLRLC